LPGLCRQDYKEVLDKFEKRIAELREKREALKKPAVSQTDMDAPRPKEVFLMDAEEDGPFETILEK
jgi:hypothetical protein